MTFDCLTAWWLHGKLNCTTIRSLYANGWGDSPLVVLHQKPSSVCMCARCGEMTKEQACLLHSVYNLEVEVVRKRNDQGTGCWSDGPIGEELQAQSQTTTSIEWSHGFSSVWQEWKSEKWCSKLQFDLFCKLGLPNNSVNRHEWL